MVEKPTYPVKDIKWVLHACRADEPLPPGDSRRHDFSALRGGDVVTDLADSLEQALPEGEFHHRILCGHRGSGKSTELLSLKEWADGNGFLTVWVEVDLYFGLAELQFSDLYLLTAESVTKAMQEIKSPLPADRLQKVVDWFAEVTEENLEQIKSELSTQAGAEIGSSGLLSLMLGKLFVRFSAGVKAGSELNQRVRQRLRQAPNTLIDLTNDLLRRANEQLLDKDRTRGLLLLFDNLDRYETDTINGLLLRGSTLIRSIACHAVFTMPINLQYSSTGTYWDDYGPPAILPMVSFRKPADTWGRTVADSAFDESAVDEMLVALKRRIDVEGLFQEPGDARLLVKMSGGCMRDLLHLVNLVRQKSRTRLAEPLTHLTSSGVRSAIAGYRITLTEGLQEKDYRRLSAIARREPQAQVLDDHMLQLLARRIALRYPDDGGRWTDVHPLVIETEEFQSAYIASAPIVRS